MPNVEEHAVAVGSQSLAKRPFDALDGLILSQLVYMPMEGWLDAGQRRTVRESWALLKEHTDPETLDQFQRKRFHLTEVCAGLPRYQNWLAHDYVNHIDLAEETQFCAAVYDVAPDTCFISFRGTDLSIAGWKEDLNLSFMVVPAQQEAVAYVQKIAAQGFAQMDLGGHSKGGNLAVYAGAFADKGAQAKLRSIYSFDGPGMFEECLQMDGYLRIKERIQSFIPQSSVVGMLMNYHPVYTVVEAHSLGILQHDAMTWQVRDGDFVRLNELDTTGKITDETLHSWLATMDENDRRTLVDTVYSVLNASQAQLITDLSEDWRDTAAKALEALREIDPELRKNVHIMLRSLFSTGASEVIKSILPKAARDGLALLDWKKRRNG